MKCFALGVILIGLTGCGGTAEVAETKAGETVPAGGTPLLKTVAKVAPSVVIPAGTRLRVRTTTTLSTKSAVNGESFSGNLAEPIEVGGKIVMPKNADVEGVVVSSDDGGRVKGVASLSLRLTRVNSIPVETGVFVRNAPATKKDDAVKVGVGAGIGAAIGAIAGGGKGAAIGAASGAGAGTGVVLATRGKPAVVSAESVVTFRLTSAVSVD